MPDVSGAGPRKDLHAFLFEFVEVSKIVRFQAGDDGDANTHLAQSDTAVIDCPA